MSHKASTSWSALETSITEMQSRIVKKQWWKHSNPSLFMKNKKQLKKCGKIIFLYSKIFCFFELQLVWFKNLKQPPIILSANNDNRNIANIIT